MEIRISDRGQGIPQEHREFIFDRFRMGDETSTRRPGGVGIGLALAKTIVEAHGSKIELLNSDQPGTTFRFELPLVPRTAGWQSGRTPPSILVIDDEPNTLELVRTILGRTAYRVSCAASAEEGLVLFERDRFDLVLCDRSLQDADGLDVTRLLVASGKGVPVCILSAHGDEQAVKEALEAGATGYIHKPFRIDELLMQVSASLANGAGRPAGSG